MTASRTLRYDAAGRTLTLTVDGKAECYRVEAIRDHRGEVVGRRLHKLSDGQCYDIDASAKTCECLGHLRWGRCKHADAIAKLESLNMLDNSTATATPATPDPVATEDDMNKTATPTTPTSSPTAPAHTTAAAISAAEARLVAGLDNAAAYLAGVGSNAEAALARVESAARDAAARLSDVAKRAAEALATLAAFAEGLASQFDGFAPAPVAPPPAVPTSTRAMPAPVRQDAASAPISPEAGPTPAVATTPPQGGDADLLAGSTPAAPATAPVEDDLLAPSAVPAVIKDRMAAPSPEPGRNGRRRTQRSTT